MARQRITEQIEFGAAIMQEARQTFPARERVTDRFGKRTEVDDPLAGRARGALPRRIAADPGHWLKSVPGRRFPPRGKMTIDLLGGK
jgi:hypothetical protein